MGFKSGCVIVTHVKSKQWDLYNTKYFETKVNCRKYKKLMSSDILEKLSVVLTTSTNFKTEYTRNCLYVHWRRK